MTHSHLKFFENSLNNHKKIKIVFPFFLIFVGFKKSLGTIFLYSWLLWFNWFSHELLRILNYFTVGDVDLLLGLHFAGISLSTLIFWKESFASFCGIIKQILIQINHVEFDWIWHCDPAFYTFLRFLDMWTEEVSADFRCSEIDNGTYCLSEQLCWLFSYVLS